MRDKLPANLIFKYLPKKALFSIDEIAKNCDWDHPSTGIRYYQAKPMLKALLVWFIKGRPPLDQFVSFLKQDRPTRRACGFKAFTPSFPTFSNFQRKMGFKFLETFFSKLVTLMFDEGMVTGRHLAIDSTFIKAWSQRKSKDKKTKEFKVAKNCDFAKVGKVTGTFDLGYRVHTVTVTKSKIPIAVMVVPGNMHDRRAFDEILQLGLQQLPDPLAISADKGYSSGKNRKLVENAGAACFIRPSKTDLKGNPMKHFIADGLSEETYWKVYWKRNAVELTFAFAKGQCGLRRPRVVNEYRIKQHVYLSFITMLFHIFASAALGLSKTCYSNFY